MLAAVKTIKVTLVRSLNRRTEKTKAAARGLGLRRLNDAKIVALTPENKGMIDKIAYLIKITEVE